MPSGIIGTLSGAATLTYKPQTRAKVSIVAYGSNGTVSLNGVPVIAANTTSSVPSIVWVEAGQTLTVQTSSSANALVSALEGN